MKNSLIKATLFISLLAIFSCNGTAQTNDTEAREKSNTAQEVQDSTNVGTVFHKLTLPEALKKAEAEGKKVFIDCYTQKCIPCKKMVKNIFPQKICGDYFNANFVCIMRDMEEEGEGKEIAKKFNIRIYPTYLILNSDGSQFTQAFAAIQDAEKFVAKMKEIVAEAEKEQK